jgi:hypothetical protein
MTAPTKPKTDPVFERFQQETAGHQMTILHEDGLYRHVRFAPPTSSFCWFDLVTWPGTLAIKGGMGTFVFSRDTDMFAFFRATRPGSINADYWAEKLPGGRDSAREYSEDALRVELAAILAEHEAEYSALVVRYQEKKATYDALPHGERWPYAARGMREPVEPKPVEEIRELIADYDDDGRLGYEPDARTLLGELESAGVTSDTWELKLRKYTVFYLWCCYAIRWGIAEYDKARAVDVALPADSAVAA